MLGLATVFLTLWVLVSISENEGYLDPQYAQISRLVYVLEILWGLGFEGPGLTRLREDQRITWSLTALVGLGRDSNTPFWPDTLPLTPPTSQHNPDFLLPSLPPRSSGMVRKYLLPP